MQQRTIARPIELQGIGLHSGQPVMLKFSPAASDMGIVFYRSDIANASPIAANFANVKDTLMSSNLVNQQQQRVGTVEHLMSAIAALGIDNLRVEVSAAEIPIMDGSAAPFLQRLQIAGITTLNAPKYFIRVLQAVSVRQDDKLASLTPSVIANSATDPRHNRAGFTIKFQIAFDHPAFEHNGDVVEVDFSSQNFAQWVAPARTFGFTKDIDYLKRNNLGLGGSMENAIVVDEKKVLNPDGLRFVDEFVRHKILDAVGDLYLAGHQLLGEFCAYKSGHALNNLLLKQLFSDPNNYEIVTFDDENSCPIDYFC